MMMRAIALCRMVSVPGMIGSQRPPFCTPHATPVVMCGVTNMSFLLGFAPRMIHSVKSVVLVS